LRLVRLVLRVRREEHTMSTARSTSTRAARIALGAIAVSGCADVGAGDMEQSAAQLASHDAQAEEASRTELGSTSQALTNWKSLLCKVADEVPSGSWGNFTMHDTECTGDSSPRTYYFGSGGPGDYASTIATATYCALAGSGTKNADATFRTPVGAFGAKSTVIAHSRNNQTRHIETEHLGKAVAFGVEVPLQFAEATWDFPTEHQPRQSLPAVHDDPRSGSHRYTQTVPDQTGYYANIDGFTLKHWQTGGDGWFMVGPVKVTIDMDISSDEKLKYYGNGRFSPGGASWASYADAVAAYEDCLSTCQPGPVSCEFVCGGPSADQVRGHELLCGDDGCTSTYFKDLTDGVLPYSGPEGGARGDILYGDPLPNYWQTGFPGWHSLSALGEPKYSLLSEDPGRSLHLDLDITAGYKLGSIATIQVGTKLDFDTRAGMALRSEIIPDGDLGGASGDRGRVHLDLDAETAINLNAWVHLKVPLVFTTIEFYADYDIIDRSGDGHTSGTRQASMIEWTVDRDGANNAPTQACTAYQTPEPPRQHPPVTKAVDFVEDLATASVDQMHPCNVRICVPSSPNSTTGKFTKYNWNADTHQLVAQSTNTSCRVCESTASLCNADNDVLTAMQTSSSCEGGPICGGAESCDSIDDCSQPLGGGGCIGGCCVQIR
jgi:hypothetical protein